MKGVRWKKYWKTTFRKNLAL